MRPDLRVSGRIQNIEFLEAADEVCSLFLHTRGSQNHWDRVLRRLTWSLTHFIFRRSTSWARQWSFVGGIGSPEAFRTKDPGICSSPLANYIRSCICS